MRLTHTMIMMFIGSFLIQYFVMSPIMSYKTENITNSLGKVYLSTLMGLFMVLLEIAMHDHQYDVFSLKNYVFVGGLILVVIYLYRTQKYVTDKQYLEEMIEHHSMALLTSNRILEKTNDYNVSKLAKNILQTQTDEIQRMKEMLSK
jgi:Ca2+/Na+ antiporter